MLEAVSSTYNCLQIPVTPHSPHTRVHRGTFHIHTHTHRQCIRIHTNTHSQTQKVNTSTHMNIRYISHTTHTHTKTTSAHHTTRSYFPTLSRSTFSTEDKKGAKIVFWCKFNNWPRYLHFRPLYIRFVLFNVLLNYSLIKPSFAALYSKKRFFFHYGRTLKSVS